jgi:hypothetical protein
VLAVEAERSAARREQGETGRGRNERPERADNLEQVLEVVEQHEPVTVREARRECLLERHAAALGQADRPSDRWQHERGVCERGERHEERAVGKPRGSRARHLEREARLADPAAAGQRHEAHVRAGEERDDRIHLLIAADERGGRRGEAGVRWPCGRRVEGGILLEDPTLEPLEVGTRLDPETVEQLGPRGLVRG